MSDTPEQLPEPQDVILGQIVLTKVMKADGTIAYREQVSETVHPVEGLGMLHSLIDSLNRTIAGQTFRSRGDAA